MPATKFDKPVFPGAKLVSATVTVTNTSGSYSNTFIDERIATSMRAFQLEIEDPSVFNDKISITTADGSFTIACDSVAGETDVTIGFLKIADDPTAVTSSEFTILNNRIGNLASLETTDKTSVVNAVNEVVDAVSDNTQAITSNTQAIANLDDKVSYETTINNLNNATTAGSYYFTANSANAPSTNAGRLLVMKSSESSYGTQIASVNSASVPYVYARSITPSGFGEWERMTTIFVQNTGSITTNSDGNYNFTSITPSGCFPIFPLNYPGYFGNGSSTSYAPFLFGGQASRTYNNTLTVFIRYQ